MRYTRAVQEEMENARSMRVPTAGERMCSALIAQSDRLINYSHQDWQLTLLNDGGGAILPLQVSHFGQLLQTINQRSACTWRVSRGVKSGFRLLQAKAVSETYLCRRTQTCSASGSHFPKRGTPMPQWQ